MTKIGICTQRNRPLVFSPRWTEENSVENENDSIYNAANESTRRRADYGYEGLSYDDGLAPHSVQRIERRSAVGGKLDGRTEARNSGQSESSRKRALWKLITEVPALAEIVGVEIESISVIREEAQRAIAGLEESDREIADAAKTIGLQIQIFAIHLVTPPSPTARS